MAELLDSGARRDFGTGAVRDLAEGKGRCDLLPLSIIGAQMHDAVLADIGTYVCLGGALSLWKAIYFFAEQRADADIYTAMLEASKQYEDGCQKYGERNWEKGIPLHVFIDSGVRHYLKYLRGDTDEPHDRAFVWNMLGAIWTHENKPELIDLPFAVAGNPVTPDSAVDKPEPRDVKPIDRVEPWSLADNDRLQTLLCHDCCRWKECPIELQVKDESCFDYCIAHPAEARKIMDDMEGKNETLRN